MSGAHTPGPWEFGRDRRWLFRDNLKADGKFSSSTVLRIDDDAFRPSEADARLIAVAPELLSALEAIRDLPGEVNTSNYDHDDVCALNNAHIEAFQIARAAIAKAASLRPVGDA